jgi:hypothetical protein
MDRGVPSGLECACMSMAPVSVCAQAGKPAINSVITGNMAKHFNLAGAGRAVCIPPIRSQI